MDNFKKNKRDVRDAIKDSIRNQEVIPLIINITSMMLNRMNLEEEPLNHLNGEHLFEKIRGIIYQRESWYQLNQSLRQIEDVMNNVSNIEKLYNNYIKYMSYISKLLFILTIIIICVLPIYLLNNQLLWIIWITSLAETIIITIILYFYSHKYSNKFDEYENIYLR